MDKKEIIDLLETYHNNPYRLMDILLDIQEKAEFISPEWYNTIGNALGLSVADVEQTVSFYHFFRTEHSGKFSIYLNNSAVADMSGRHSIMTALEKEAGCKFGHSTDDGLIGLYHTSCIGMNDQEPAALINGQVFTSMTVDSVKSLINGIRAGKSIDQIYSESGSPGDGKNSSSDLSSNVKNNIYKSGPILDKNYTIGEALGKALAQSADWTIKEIKDSGLRGRGGAGFSTGMKWDFCRKAQDDKHYIICNADEGEPGTFKDRVLLTEVPEQLFEGMAIGGYAIGASEGILYLRYEYRYLKKYLENVLSSMRSRGFLGNNILGKGFDFDIRIQSGAGAYVCGEESALIESMEGKRGEPRDRPPFPVEKGYLGKPTAVNNVETLCSAVKILLKGAAWYKAMGTADSAGTKLLSISGDCKKPGVYEVEWGISVSEVLKMAEAENETQAVQVGGPSGTLIGKNEFDRKLSFSDLATGGAFIIIGAKRDLLKDVVGNFLEFFAEESCGSCVPCRNIPAVLKKKLDLILAGKGSPSDLKDLETWPDVMKLNRCGLGQTAANPIVYSIKNFRHLYEKLLNKESQYVPDFDISKATAEAAEAAGRKAVTN
jgi:[NiFe] hydrogenase diaphorase moiety large subunit